MDHCINEGFGITLLSSSYVVFTDSGHGKRGSPNHGSYYIIKVGPGVLTVS